MQGGGRLLEIGCGGGQRLAWLSEKMKMNVHGVESSGKAVEVARQLGVDAVQGTAESLPYKNGDFDFVVFGFCLYLVDREDLFRVACEANRVLKNRGWLIIHDFYSEIPTRRDYHHKSGVYSYKMDYRQIFVWHPAYTCFSHDIMHHEKSDITDDEQEWVATSLLRKNMSYA
jgi:SAM-dependent methyltransferase